MTDPTAVAAWLDGYRRAWESNDPDDIEALFTPDAAYLTGPSDPPMEGIAAIVAGWLEGRDEPGDWAFTARLAGIDGDTAFVEGRTDYLGNGQLYDNLWVIEFAADGRARRFTEWYMHRPGSSGPSS